MLREYPSAQPEVYPMKSITSFNAIEKLWDAFSGFSLPLNIVSGNDQTYLSNEFRTLLNPNGIQHKQISPYQPSTSGQVEPPLYFLSAHITNLHNKSIYQIIPILLLSEKISLINIYVKNI